VERFGWSLHEIDQTSIETLLPFALDAARRGRKKTIMSAEHVYCDQVDWL